jgi:hypothetical protein
MKLFTFIALLIGLPALAQEEKIRVAEMRQHTQIVAKSGAVLYTMTKINRFSEEKDETILLIRDEGYGELIVRDVMSYEKHFSSHRISDLENRAFLQHSFPMQLGAKSRSETLKLGRDPEAIVWPEVILKIETNGGVWERNEKELRDEANMRPFRREIRPTMNSFVLEALERMRGTLLGADPGDLGFQDFANLVLYGIDKEAVSPSDAKVVETVPDCAFDESFGYPCTESQLARIAKAADEGKKLHGYW